MLREDLNHIAAQMHRPVLPNLTVVNIIPATKALMMTVNVKQALEHIEAGTDRFEEKFRKSIQSSTVNMTDRQRVWNEIARYLWERMGRPQRVLDPAGGRGEFVNAVPAQERWLVDVVDYPERHTDPDVRIVIGDLFEIDLPPGYFDAVFASNLLEHFRSPEDVARFLDIASGGKFDRYARQPPDVDRLVDQLADARKIERFDQVLERPQLHRLDGRVAVFAGGDH